MSHRRDHHIQPSSRGDRNPSDRNDESNYRPPRLVEHGPLGALVRGASWKGVDSIGELQPDESYPG